MNFRTEIKLPASDKFLSHSDNGFLTGSCFSEHIYAKMQRAKFPAMSNPTGILFNPASISNMIRRVAAGTPYTTDELHQSNGLYHSWEHHGSFSGTNPDTVLQQINNNIEQAHNTLTNSNYVIITFGTAWIYRLATNGNVVANCHKQPDTLFKRERLSAQEIISDYSELFETTLKTHKVIFTISPVRHLKDGFEGNSLSKAILRVAIGELTERYPNASYFPAYEIMNDDLRDYRFYNEDMTHPTPQAVDYIWHKFCEWSMQDDTKALLPRLETLAKATEHRTINTNSTELKAFHTRMLSTTDQLSKALPMVDFSAEYAKFGEQ